MTAGPRRNAPSHRRTALVAIVGAALALVPAALLWGFTVDDALIPARYAAHLAGGHGYRFNAGGLVTDGVTPLGFAYLLAPFAAAGPLRALLAAKVIGLVAWTLASGALAVAIDRAGGGFQRFVGLALVGASAPLAAWSVAGLETGLVAAVASFAVTFHALSRPRTGAALAGAAAAMRPELLPWALVIGLAPPADAGQGGASRPLRLALAAGPFVAVALVRLAIFGRATPLSAIAKPPDATLGAKYAFACFLLTGPLALIAPFVWRRLGSWPRFLLAAVGAHFVAVALVGGDWMPLSRLVVPVLPSVALAGAYVAIASPAWLAVARAVLALSGELFVLLRVGPTAAGVGRDRLAVIEELRPPLAGARVVAALDIGWLGAATEATIVDLAGVTDPAIAALPGGHTTKYVPPTILDARGVDSLVLLLDEGAPLRAPWTDSRFSRGVERWIATFPEIAVEFEPVALAERTRLRYVVLRRSVHAATSLQSGRMQTVSLNQREPSASWR